MAGPTDTGDKIPPDFDSIPWCRDLFLSPLLRAVPTLERNLPDHNPIHSNTLFGSTLKTPTTVRALQSFVTLTDIAPSSDSSSLLQRRSSTSDPAATEAVSETATPTDIAAIAYHQPVGTNWIILYSLGTGLNGPAGIVHGGITMTMLDVVMATRSHTHAGGLPVLTIEFNMEFVKMVKAPCVVMAQGRVVAEEEDGKFLRLTSELVDGQGQVLARAKARFRVKEPRPIESGKL